MTSKAKRSCPELLEPKDAKKRAPPADTQTPNCLAANNIRIEGAESVGRSYSAKGLTKKGLGAERLAWKNKTHSVPLAKQVMNSLTMKYCHLAKASKEQVMDYFRNTWAITDTLFEGLAHDSSFYLFPDRLRRPLVFYFSHASALYANKFQAAGLISEPVDWHLQKVFETGVDEMSWDDMDEMQNEDFIWPTISESLAFRSKVKAMVEKVIEDMPDPRTTPITWDSPHWTLFLGFEHERIHIETSSVLIRQLPIDAVTKPAVWHYAPSERHTPSSVPTNDLVQVEAGVAVLGKAREFPSFGFDNEYGRKELSIPAFEAAKFSVSNAEFLPFVLSGGYSEKSLWVSVSGDDEGWRWVCYRKARHPCFWVATAKMKEYHSPVQKDDGHPNAGTGETFMYRAIYDIMRMPWDWPVDVNYHEAKAFCRWKSRRDGRTYRLPTEGETHLMRGVTALCDGDVRDAERDVIMRDDVGGNTNLRYGSSSAVDLHPPACTGFYDTMGNTWEWIEDHFDFLPGGEIHPIYDDFSTPCFDGWHTMISGGSWVSTGDQASYFARYAFRRHFFQHLGFRYVVTSAKEEWPGQSSAANLWENRAEMASALVELDSQHALPVFSEKAINFNKNFTDICAKARDPAADKSSVLHLGCGVGSLTFELCTKFDLAVGVDRSEPNVRLARILQHHGEVTYELADEGVLTEGRVATVPDYIDRARAAFFNLDACCIGVNTCDTSKQVSALGPFSVVIVDNFLTDLIQPLDLVSKLHTMVAENGKLIVASSNDWNPTTTPRNSWLGGFMMNGERCNTLSMLKHQLGKHFTLELEENVPRMTRAHSRKYELQLLQVTVWKRE